ncbi:MAG: response regulator [Gemmatimonadota bacterium]
MAALTVLVADDDPVTLQVLGTGLRHAGYKVVIAMDAMQTVMVAHRTKPDAIVLDVMMPGGTGFDVLKKLKVSSETQLIPVIAISGLPDPGLEEKVKDLGADYFLPKPIHIPDLTQALDKLLA